MVRQLLVVILFLAAIQHSVAAQEEQAQRAEVAGAETKK
jgi:hypothetical protein